MPIVTFEQVPIGADFKFEGEVFPSGYAGVTGTMIPGDTYRKVDAERGRSKTGIISLPIQPQSEVLWINSWFDRWFWSLIY